MHRLEVEFAQTAFTLSINQAEGVATITVHAPIVLRVPRSENRIVTDVRLLGCVTSNPTRDLYSGFADCTSKVWMKSGT